MKDTAGVCISPLLLTFFPEHSLKAALLLSSSPRPKYRQTTDTSARAQY